MHYYVNIFVTLTMKDETKYVDKRKISNYAHATIEMWARISSG